MPCLQALTGTLLLEAEHRMSTKTHQKILFENRLTKGRDNKSKPDK